MNSQQQVTRSRIDGILEEFAIRRDLLIAGQRIKEAEYLNRLETAGYKAGHQIELKELGNQSKEDIARLDGELKIDLAGLAGANKIDIALLSADLGLERERVLGDANYTGKIALAESKNAIKLDTARVEGQFKVDLAQLEGGFKVELARLDADSIHALSQIRIANIYSVGDIDIIGIQEEGVFRVERISLKSNTNIAIERLSTSAQQQSLLLNGQTDDAIEQLSGELDRINLVDDTNLKLLFIGAQTDAEINTDHNQTLTEIQSILSDAAETVRSKYASTEREIDFDINSATIDLQLMRLLSALRIDSDFARSLAGRGYDYSNTIMDIAAQNALTELRLKDDRDGLVLETSYKTNLTNTEIQNTITSTTSRIEDEGKRGLIERNYDDTLTNLDIAQTLRLALLRIEDERLTTDIELDADRVLTLADLANEARLNGAKIAAEYDKVALENGFDLQLATIELGKDTQILSLRTGTDFDLLALEIASDLQTFKSDMMQLTQSVSTRLSAERTGYEIQLAADREGLTIENASYLRILDGQLRGDEAIATLELSFEAQSAQHEIDHAGTLSGYRVLEISTDALNESLAIRNDADARAQQIRTLSDVRQLATQTTGQLEVNEITTAAANQVAEDGSVAAIRNKSRLDEADARYKHIAGDKNRGILGTADMEAGFDVANAVAADADNEDDLIYRAEEDLFFTAQRANNRFLSAISRHGVDIDIAYSDAANNAAKDALDAAKIEADFKDDADLIETKAAEQYDSRLAIAVKNAEISMGRKTSSAASRARMAGAEAGKNVDLAYEVAANNAILAGAQAANILAMANQHASAEMSSAEETYNSVITSAFAVATNLITEVNSEISYAGAAQEYAQEVARKATDLVNLNAEALAAATQESRNFSYNIHSVVGIEDLPTINPTNAVDISNQLPPPPIFASS